LLIGPFVFVHVPKTGGTWFKLAVRNARCDWSFRKINRHDELRSLSAEEQALPVIWCVRNPWDWHVSRYTFWSGHWKARTGGFKLPREQWSKEERYFDGVLEKHGDSLSAFIHAVHHIAPDGAGAHHSLSGFVERGCRRSTGELPSEPVRFEQLQAGLRERIVSLFGDQTPRKLLQSLSQMPTVNASPQRGPYQSYYDDATRGVVAEVERDVIERYGYTFEDAQ
jgi:hypothetical protein